MPRYEPAALYPLESSSLFQALRSYRQNKPMVSIYQTFYKIVYIQLEIEQYGIRC